MHPVLDAFAGGDIEGAIELTTPEIAVRPPITGTPEDCVKKIRADIVPSGLNQMIMG